MKTKFIGIDIGGTTIKFAVVDIEGKILKKWVEDTEVNDNGKWIPEIILKSIVQNIEKIDEYVGIGVGVPGPVKSGVVEKAVNLGWYKMDLKTFLETNLKMPTVILNDANAAALGELWKSSLKNVKNLVFVTLGTGVGGGIVIDGKIVNGLNSSAGEIGHIPVDVSDTRLCGCGNVNCLECYGSASGMVNTMNQFQNENGEKNIKNAQELFELIKIKNINALKTLNFTVEILGKAIAGILNTLDPEEIVIGGGVSEAGDDLLIPLEKAINKFVFPQIRNSYRLRKAEAGNDAGVLGVVYQIIHSEL